MRPSRFLTIKDMLIQRHDLHSGLAAIALASIGGLQFSQPTASRSKFDDMVYSYVNLIQVTAVLWNSDLFMI